MQITKKRLKQIIAEEVQKLDEMNIMPTPAYHDYDRGSQTDRTAAAMQGTPEGQRHLEISDLILDLAESDLENLVNAISMLPHNAKQAIKARLGGGKRDDSKFQMGAEKYGGVDRPFQEALNRRNKKRK